MSDDRLVRLSVNMNQETAEALKDLAQERGISYTEAVRRAIMLTDYLMSVEDEGGFVEIVDGKGRNKTVSRVSFS